MKITQRFRAAAQAFNTSKNAMGEELALGRRFLKYGNNKPLVQDWSKVVMSDRELYSGYPYAAINNRANKVAQLAEENLKTDSTPEVMKAAKAKGEEVRHPYLDLIDESLTFDNDKFWYDISTFLDLEGVYYLLVVRNVQGDRVGNVQEFKLLNPYNVRRIVNEDTLEVGGYVESRKGLVREIAPQLIIEMRKLNPFSEDDPWAMTDAAKTAQFTLKQSGDYTRHSLKNNMAAPGIISTDVLLDPQQFDNFVDRITNQEKGIPLFGNGAGAITWDAMQIDMDKAGLKDINEINRSELFAVSGVGKTMMAIEESGTTRDTAKVQKDLFVENHVMPQLKLILSALNQDYKRYYMSEYLKNKYRLYIDNPLGSDRDAESKDVEIRDSTLKLYDDLVAMGYKRELAAKYAAGEITLEELGDPTEEPRPNPIIEAAKLKVGDNPINPNLEPPAADPPKPPKKKPKEKQEIDDKHEHFLEAAPLVHNLFDEESQGVITTQQGALENSVVSIEARVVNDCLNRMFKNESKFDTDNELITERQRKDHEQELAMVLGAFYGVVIPLFATGIMAKRAQEFGLFGDFTLNTEVKKYIKETAKKAAESHIGTIVEDLRSAAKETYDKAVEAEIKAIKDAGRSVTDADLKLARAKALEGQSQQQIISAIKKEYSGNIATTRAKAIARTETNRAFTQSQFQADLQFLKQNNLTDQAYKKWITRSGNPCPICNDLAKQPPIPFKQNFADLGDELVATYTEDGKTKVRKQLVNFQELSAGNAHVNCSCIYMLIIQN
jgi:hypothetical protein